uniref:Trypsin inhibitor n=1 Tax=Allium cepa TaxID=4679 RepID=Q8RVY7_ALLCE|nr:trypsin inhibitor [Allium cepa]
MKAALVIFLLIAMLGVLAAEAYPNLRQVVVTGDEEEGGCCDSCGSCDRRAPDLARCECRDVVTSCGPGCKRCEEADLDLNPPRYVCKDMSFHSCQTRCSIL